LLLGTVLVATLALPHSTGCWRATAGNQVSNRVSVSTRSPQRDGQVRRSSDKQGHPGRSPPHRRPSVAARSSPWSWPWLGAGAALAATALAATGGSQTIPEPLAGTRVFDKGFTLELVPGDAAEDYDFDPTNLKDTQAAGAELQEADVSDERLLRILTQASTDEEVNVLVWKCLGYRYRNGQWDNSGVFPKFRAQHPTPPDFIGVTRIYTQQMDEPTLQAVTKLHKSVPTNYINALKEAFRHLGWTGFKPEDLNPNRRRRAMVTQWLLYYRAELFGVPLEELLRRKAARATEAV
jgi:hypothetical protein